MYTIDYMDEKIDVLETDLEAIKKGEFREIETFRCDNCRFAILNVKRYMK